MVWPFSRFRKPPAPMRGTIEAIYGMIVAQAREPLFYRDLGAPDTVNGRFDMLLLHLWLVLRWMNPKDNVKENLTDESMQGELAQGLFDRFCSDMDDNLRELGTSDLRVPKKMREFGRAFYGRTKAYDVALGEGREALATALSKNIYYGLDIENARRLAVYVEAANADLGMRDDMTLTSGMWHFPSPEIALQTTLGTP